MKDWIGKTKKQLRRAYLGTDNFSIISDNCWGGFMHQHLGIPYKSPFIGLFIFSPDYLVMLRDLKYYLSKADLTFISHDESKYREEVVKNGEYNKYPIGLLGGKVEIHFLHYTDQYEAQEKWERRLKRIKWENLIIKFSDRDLCTPSLLNEFHQLPYHQTLSFSIKPTGHPNNYNFDTQANEWKVFKKFVSPTRLLKKHLGSKCK